MPSTVIFQRLPEYRTVWQAHALAGCVHACVPAFVRACMCVRACVRAHPRAVLLRRHGALRACIGLLLVEPNAPPATLTTCAAVVRVWITRSAPCPIDPVCDHSAWRPDQLWHNMLAIATRVAQHPPCTVHHVAYSLHPFVRRSTVRPTASERRSFSQCRTHAIHPL
jgi:hypothetical protein